MISEEYNYTVYDKQTKMFVKHLSMPTLEDALLNVDQDTEYLVYGAYDKDSTFDGQNLIESEKDK